MESFFSPSCFHSLDLSSTVPSMAYSRAPSLGLVLYLLKNSTADFFQFHQSHRQSLGKLQSLDQLPPEELKEVILDAFALPEVVLITRLVSQLWPDLRLLSSQLCQGLVSGTGGVEKISSVQRNLLAKRRLVQLINNRAKLLALCSCILQHTATGSLEMFFSHHREVLPWPFLSRRYRDLPVCLVAPPWVLPSALHSCRPQGFRDARRRPVPLTPRRQYGRIFHFPLHFKAEFDVEKVTLKLLGFSLSRLIQRLPGERRAWPQPFPR